MIKLILSFIFGNWCKHDWRILKESEIPNSYVDYDSALSYPYVQKVCLLTCTKCGKLERKAL